MSDPYLQLLDTAIEHLSSMKARGARFVSVSPKTLAALNQPPPVQSRVANCPTTPSVSAAAAPSFERTDAEAMRDATVSSPAAEHGAGATLPARSRDNAEAFAALQAQTLSCMKCSNLAASRKNVVFGVGNPNAELMFVGEAPGADEDERGEPFVGKAGQLLTKIINTMGLSRDSVYIANILKCRPDTPGQSSGNRKPTPEEMQTCIPYLHEQIDLIQPRVLVALGGTAVEGLLGRTAGITALRGNWHTYRGIPLMPTYHPAYLLRNQALAEKRRVWEDMLKVMEKLEMPISDKQRGFFLKSP